MLIIELYVPIHILSSYDKIFIMTIFGMYFNHIVNKPIISEKKLEENSFIYH